MLDTIIQMIKETDRIFFDDALRGDVSQKGASDYVTRADLSISDYLHKQLTEAFPHIGFLSEEETERAEKQASFWILDPIDGTTNFMHGFHGSCVSLGLCEKGEITLGVIYNPDTKELFHATKGGGSYLNGVPIRCSSYGKLSDSLGLLEYNAYFKEDKAAALSHAERIYTACQDIRTMGSAALSLVYVACGRADVFLGRYLKPWDYAAANILIKEAGGRMTDMEGNVPVLDMNCHIVATNGVLHDAFLELIK